MGTTATVAVLFCDVVGSTERLTRMGDEAGDEFRRRFFAGLRRDVVEHSGTEVKHLGDGLMVVFEHSAVDAVNCAAAMHRTAGEFDPDDPVALRIGISIGEVACEDDDWFGTPVVEAARLCALAPSGRTYAPALLASVIGSRGRAHRFRPIGSVQLKGLAAPVALVEIDGPDPEPSADGGAGPTSSMPWGAAVHGTTVHGATVVDRELIGGAPTVGQPPPVPDVDRSRPRFRRRLVASGAVVAAVAVLAGAAALVGSDRDPDSDAGSTPVGSARSELVSTPVGYAPTVERADCPADTAAAVPDATCRVLVVPESRRNPGGRQIRIPVVSVPGPAGSDVDPVVVLDVNEPVATSLSKVADVHVLSLRGFGAGEPPLSCPELESAWTASFAARADDPAAIDARADAARRCAARLRAAGVQLEGYSMLEAADDIRDLVRALDLGRVSAAAGGYTTTAAAAWARANPGSVRSLLLTNPTPPGESVMADPARSLAASFARLRHLCDTDDRCRTAYPDLATAYLQRFGQLDAGPVLVETTALGGLGPFHVLLDGRRYAAGLESAMRESSRLGLVPSAVRGAGDELTAAAGIDEDVSFYVGPTLSGAFLSVTCSYDERLNRTAEISDSAMRQFAGANEPTFGRLCEAWGVPSVFDELSRPLTIDVPVLIAVGALSVSGVNDWADAMAASLPRATVVDVPTMSEDLAFSPPPCLRELRARFLREPDAQLAADACRKDPPTIDFVAPG